MMIVHYCSFPLQFLPLSFFLFPLPISSISPINVCVCHSPIALFLHSTQLFCPLPAYINLSFIKFFAASISYHLHTLIVFFI